MIAAALAWALPARAESAAMARIRLGEQAFAAGRYGEALEAFLAADHLSPQPALLYNIAMCEWELGRIADAVNSFRDYLLQQPDLSRRELREIQRVLAELRPGHGDVTIVAADRGAELLVDGRDVGAVPLAHPVAVEPGEHAYTAQVAGRSSLVVMRTVEAGGSLTIDLTLPAESAAAASGDDDDEADQSEAPRPGGALWTFLALTSGTLVATAVTGGVALARESDNDDTLAVTSVVLSLVALVEGLVTGALTIRYFVGRREFERMEPGREE
jgi:tetratricopeptide (TPR) repeat protein